VGAVAGGVSATAGAVLVDDLSESDDDDEVQDPRSGVQEIIWSAATSAPVAALTFDDGPHPELTPRILEVLDRYAVRATFMALGHAAEQHPEILADIVARGHEVGHHTWRHLHLAKTRAATTRREIEVGTRIVEDIAGVPVRLFRPPQGRLSEAVVRLVTSMRQDIVLWSVSRGKKGWRTPERVAQHVVDEVDRGDIIDFHDGIGRGTFEPRSDLADELMRRRQVEVEALPDIIERLAQRGIRLGTVSDLRSARDGRL
jgi:peptidoglycan/xylan/chitin deacetylase (PgdA/CDA1 family)